MAYGKNTYSEIAKLPITYKRNIVVSKCSSGGYSIAQQSPIQEGDKTTWIYFKGAIHVKDLEHLYNDLLLLFSLFSLKIKRLLQ